MPKRIYLDYAALTPIDPRVTAEMKKHSGAAYGNPSSLYKEGVAAKKVLENSRKVVGDFIHAHKDEIYFTSGGTEANNLAIIGAVESLRKKGMEYSDMHVIISAVEHSSVIEVANHLSDREVRVEKISVEPSGVVSLEDLRRKIRPNTVVVSIMTVNNEIGTIQPIRDIAKIIRDARDASAKTSIFNFQSSIKYPLFHTDAAQAALYEDLDVQSLGVDLLTLDASKVYGPRGIGALYVKRGVPLEPIVYGGGQENGIRSGTENIPPIAGFAKALEIAAAEKGREGVRLILLKKLFMELMRKLNRDIKENGGSTSPNILNVSIPNIDSEYFIIQLDVKGIACSTKSSCLHDQDESYVLKAIGANSRTSVRFSMGRWTKRADVVATVKAIRAILTD